MPFKPVDLSKIPKHKAFGVKESVSGAKAGKRVLGGSNTQGPLTRRLQGLKKSDTRSAFGVDHAVEVEKFSLAPVKTAFHGAKAATGRGAMKAATGVQAGGAKVAAAGTKKKFNAIPKIAAGKGGKTAYKVGTAQQKVGGAIAGASPAKILGLGAAGAGGAAVGGGTAYGMNRKKF